MFGESAGQLGESCPAVRILGSPQPHCLRVTLDHCANRVSKGKENLTMV